MSSLDFGGSNGVNPNTSYFTFTFPGLPDSDWTIGVWYRRKSVVGSSEQGLWRCGPGGAANSLFMYVGEASWANGIWGSEIVNSAGTTWINTSPGVTLPGNNKDYLAVVVRESGSCKVYHIEEGAVATPDLTQPGVSGTFAGGSGFIGVIGGDAMKNPLGEFFIFDDKALSAADLTLLAAGRPAFVFGTPLVYLPFKNGSQAVEPNLGGGGSTYDATRVGTGFAPANDFFSWASPYTQPVSSNEVVRPPHPISQTELLSTAAWFNPGIDVANWFDDSIRSLVPAGRVKVWDGSSWVVKPSKDWNGTSWVAKPAKYWNGSTWVA